MNMLRENVVKPVNWPTYEGLQSKYFSSNRSLKTAMLDGILAVLGDVTCSSHTDLGTEAEVFNLAWTR